MLLVLLVACTFNIIGESLSEEEYVALSKEFISEVVLISMNTFETNQGGLNYLEKEGRQKFEDRFHKRGEWTVDQIDSILEKGWSNTKSNLFSAYCNLIANDSASFSNLLNYEHLNLPQEFYTKVEKVKQNYSSKLNDLAMENVANTHKENKLNDEAISDYSSNSSEYKNTQKINLFGILKFLMFLILVCIIVYIIIIINHRKKNREISRLQKELKAVNKELASERLKTSQLKMESKRSVITDNKRKGFDKSNSKLQKENPSIDDSISETITFEVSNSDKVNEPVFESKTFYFESFKEGYFIVNEGKENKGAWDVYQIITTNDGKGRLDLVTDKPEELIPNKDAYLINALCEVSYDSGGARSEFKSTEPGIVRQEGQQWIVEKRVKIVII